MSLILKRMLIALSLLLSATAPAWADGSADVQAKVDGALNNAKSFMVKTRYPAQAYASTLVVVAPNRSRITVAIAATTTDVVTVGETTYSSKNGAPFERAAVVPSEAAPLKSIGHVKVGATRADLLVDGVTYGAFETTVPLGADVTLTCTYNKKSFRLARCANADVTETYSNYDDPNNVVETPKNSADAPKGGK